MNGFERYMAALRGERVDVLPRLPILMGWAARYIGRDYAAFASDYRVLVEANLRCARDFGFDQVSAISDPYRETSAFGAPIEYQEETPPICLELPLAETKELALLGTPDPATSPRMLDRVRAIESYREHVGGQYSILGWVEGPAAEAADLRGVETFLMDLFDDPPFCAELMHRCVDVGIEFAAAQLRAGADTIGIGDAIVSQMSPDMYGSLVYQEEKRLVDAIHAAGGRVRLHICGNITHQLPRLAELGVDILDLDSMVDLGRARELMSADTVLVGNLDPVQAVLYSSPEAIERDVRSVYSAVGNRYMVGAGCEIPIGTPVENLAALCAPVPFTAW
ncbi:MAG TPA: uroporphyrinogen decarboxylase family protein [Longimicrobiales bacterium]